MAELYIHRIMVKDTVEALRRLREHGIVNAEVAWGGRDLSGLNAIDWTSELRDVDLDFLRPDILPPRLRPSVFSAP